MFHFSYTASEVYDILESENFFDTEVYFQRANDGLNSDEYSDSGEGNDPQHLSADQLIAQGDFRINFGTHITNSLEAECDDVENVNDLQDEAHSQNEYNLEKEDDFNNILETERSDLSKWLLNKKPPNCAKKWNKKGVTNTKFENIPPTSV